MSETRIQKKIVLINVGVHIGLTILFSPIVGGYDSKSYLTLYGLIGIFMGSLLLLIGIVSAAAEDKRISQGFMLSAGIILLLGFLCCSGPF